MIAQLTGTILRHDADGLIIDVNGVGYLVHVPVGIDTTPGPDGRLSLIIHTSVREDAIQLFGFSDARQKLLFNKLTSVSGVGPKLGMAVLSHLSVDDVVDAVMKDDIARMTQVSGVGKKTAQRLLLELKGAIDTLGFAGTADSPTTHATSDNPLVEDLRSALLNLGYKSAQVDDAIDKLSPIPEDVNSIEPLIRQALRIL